MSKFERKAMIIVGETPAAILEEVENGYKFTYLTEYIDQNLPAASLTLPVRGEPYFSNILFVASGEIVQ